MGGGGPTCGQRQLGLPHAAHVHALCPHPSRRPRRGGGRLASAPATRRLHPPRRARHLHLATAGTQGARQGRGDRARGDGRRRRPRGALPGAAAARALRGDGPVDRVRSQPVPAEGPQGRRLLARAHARRTVHAVGQGPVLLVQGPAADDLPNPDQVPGRGPPASGPAARPRVHHEGLVQLRHRRRGAGEVVPNPARRVHQDLRAAGHQLRDCAGAVGRDGRLEVRGVPVAHRGGGGHVRALRRGLRRERGGRDDAGPAAIDFADAPAAHVEDTPDTPTIDDAGGRRERQAPAPGPRLDCGGHAQERGAGADVARGRALAAGGGHPRRPRGRHDAP